MHKQEISFAQVIKFLENMDLKGGEVNPNPNPPCVRTWRSVYGMLRVWLATLNDDSPLQLPSVHHNPSSDGCAHDAERKDNAKRGFGQQNVVKKDWVLSIHFDKLKKKL